ncbi:uncharacterized protein LOC111911164 [Lactuca sativa]|uniref:uncharacterized protein LOC111911164 n=1 Tax=Lactuca sativa TaxID=4236 RepID=UPI000CD90871|nr:uncharacterized protein LOC111911164 [Lactuca sativa]
MSFQELVTSLAQNQTQFQQETKNTFSNIQAQIGDLATALNKIEQRVSREEEDEVIIVEHSKVVVPPKEPVIPNIEQPESSNKTIKPLVIPPPFPSCVMLDLGASINVMPYPFFQSLNVGSLEETGVIIQLADKSSVFPRGVLEDVLIQVNQQVFLADFYVIDLEENTSSRSSMILLGRPFMNTTHTIIDVHNRKITMEFDRETIHFNIFEAMRYPSNISPLYRADVIEPITKELFKLSYGDILKMVLNMSLDYECLKKTLERYTLDSEVEDIVKTLKVNKSTRKNVSQVALSHFLNKMPPSIIHPPTLELKVLPSYLKYAYLGKEETLPVIISSQLKDFEED